MYGTAIDELPEELLLSIFTYRDSQPPSKLKIRDEPTLELTSSLNHILKNISLVSKRWRRIVQPLLFKYARLRIDIPERESWYSCSACGGDVANTTGLRNIQRHLAESNHIEMIKALKMSPAASELPESHVSTTREDFQRPDELSTAAWAQRFYHVLQEFTSFVETKGLERSIRSFVLFTDRMVTGKLGRFLHEAAAREWRYPAAAAFWTHLLSVIDPDRVVILAPPTELACLTNAAIDTFGDWAFGDMDFHILELRQERGSTQCVTPMAEYSQLKPYPPRYPSFAPSSLLHLRSWTSCTLNEGSFLKAYGTYEYFERGPPSLVYSIKQCLVPQEGLHGTPALIKCLPALRSFTYTAIFPFANHADFLTMLPHLEEIDIQFAPDPLSSILDDKRRVGKAELSDCWQELLSAYYELASTLNTFQMSEAKFPKLKRFICRDFQIEELRTELEEVFTPMCLPVWVEQEPVGIFERVAMAAQLPVSDEIDWE